MLSGRPADAASSWWFRLATAMNASPAGVVLVLGLICVLPLTILTPPFQAPDEPQHFFRAYQLSEGDIESSSRGDAAGEVLPRSLPALEQRFLGTTELHAARPIEANPLSETLEELQRPLASADREFVPFTGSAAYSPLPYAPQALAIAGGRALGLGPLGLLFLARAVNALAAIALLACAARILPARTDVILLVGFLPMAVYEYASVAPDAATIGAAILFTALAARSQAEGWTFGRLAAAVLAGCIFCSLKPVYAPLLLAGVMPGLIRRETLGKTATTYGILLTVVLGVTVGWLLSSTAVAAAQIPGVSSSDQLRGILGRPDVYLARLAATLVHNSFFYYTSLVGILGWLSLPLPKFVYALPILGFVAILLRGAASGAPRDALGPAWNLLMAMGCFVLTLTALYLLWTPVGRPIVEGVQGRYLLPFAVLAALSLLALLRLRWPGRDRPDSLPLVAGLTLVNTAAIFATIVSAYDLF